MRNVLVLAMAFVFASGAFLALPGAAQIVPDGRLEGQVCSTSQDSYPMPLSYPEGDESCYGSPVEGATVHVTGDGLAGPIGATDKTAETDESGFFAVDALADGTYDVEVSRAGFESVSREVEVVDGRAYAAFTLVPEDVDIKGIVVDQDGDGIPNAEVHLYGPDYLDQPLRTDADGRFEARMAAGRYSVNINAPGFRGVYEDRMLDGSKEERFELVPLPPRDAMIRGTVVDQDGNPVADARVSAYTYRDYAYANDSATGAEGIAYDESYYYDGGENFTFTDAAGRYKLGVYSGSGQLTLSKEGYAYRYLDIQVGRDEVQTQDVEMLKFPEKTARISGQIVGLDGGLDNVYVSLRSPLYGITECSMKAADAQGGGGNGSSGAEPGVAKMSVAPDYYYEECAITIHPDGRFEGTVTPGYSIISVYHDHWSTCTQTTDADGDFRQDCGPEYFSYAQTLTLPANADTQVDITLKARPEPDATVSGYLVDGETGKAIPDATISFNNQETYGYGSAETDRDGSFSIRLRSGYHSVYVYAQGFLTWEGVLEVPEGNSPFDVTLTPGNESYGYCCYHYAGRGYAEDSVVMEPSAAGAPSDDMDAKSSFAISDEATGDGAMTGDGESNSADAQYVDLGGGLGPYDAAKRQQALADGADDSNGAPGPALAFIGVAVLALAAVLRRK